MWGKWVQGQHANQAIKVKIANKKQRHNFFKRNPIKEEKLEIQKNLNSNIGYEVEAVNLD